PSFELLIFNRYGQLIFRTRNATRPWDGKVGGKPVPTGTYYFTLDLKQAGLKQAGFVDVIR
ncbi:MAG TPA: gliding motility-associated C-terminal domain-containing protein, partial [Flavisolibacter sp.]